MPTRSIKETPPNPPFARGGVRESPRPRTASPPCKGGVGGGRRTGSGWCATRALAALALGWAFLGCGSVLAQATGPAPDVDRARTEAEARGQAAEADRLVKQGDFAAALPFYRAERASRAALGDLRYEAYAARAIGCCHERLGDFDAAVEAWMGAIALDARRQDPGFEGYDWLLIGTVEFRRQRSREALDALSKAVPLLATAGDREHEADTHLLLSKALRGLGRFADVGPHLDRVLELADALDDPKRRTDAWAQSGSVALETEDPELAVEWLSDARDAYAELGHIAEAAEADRLLGDAFLQLDRPDVAQARVEDAAAAHQRLDDALSLADDLEFLAAVKADAQDLPAARALARRAVAARRDGDDPAGEIDARVQLAHFESLAGDWPAAAATLNEAVSLVLAEGEPADQVRLLILAADVDTRAGQSTRGRSRLDKAAQIADQADNGALRALVAAARQRTPR